MVNKELIKSITRSVINETYGVDRSNFYSDEEYKKELLIRNVITEIQDSFRSHDFTALSELLNNLSTESLLNFLPEGVDPYDDSNF